MKAITEAWVRKAEEDFIAVTSLNIPNLICFHCQQCAEKYIKARLQEAEILFPKTHDLEQLLDLALTVEPLWEALRSSLAQLTNYASEFRYPGEDADVAEAKRAREMCSMIREHARHSLGLDKPPQPPLRVREKKTPYRTRKRK
jgi:HEPN domain-containing protein